VRGILFPQINFLPPLPLFPRRLPRVLQCRPQFVSPCRESENPGRSFGTGCRESGFRCRSLGNPAANLNPAAAFLIAFASNFSAFARNLTGLAANLPPPAAIYNLLPQSSLCYFQQNTVGRVTPCAPSSGNPAPARRGLTRPTCGFNLSPCNHHLSTIH
jgi:hypothetical protein